VGYREKIVSDRASRLKSFSPEGVQPQPPQRPKQLNGFSELLAQIACTQVCSLDFQRAETVRCLERRAEPFQHL
jgi:hypothetical protein